MGWEHTKLSKSVTVSRYYRLVEAKDREKIADFIQERFTERYITPLRMQDRGYKHGFSTMAICCLMIESLESFWQGWPNSNRKSALSFCYFFDKNRPVEVFRGHSQEFYKHVRCGILHQAETTGGWRIWRSGPLFDSRNKIINATAFHNRLKRCLKEYCDKLTRADWNSELWKNLRKKMEVVCNNCNPEYKKVKIHYFAYGSNMLLEHMHSRCPSAKPIGPARLQHKRVVFNKKSRDGSGKANLVDSYGDEAWGVLYELTIADLNTLDDIEVDYTRRCFQLRRARKRVMAEVYISGVLTEDAVAYDSYKGLMLAGAQEHDLPQPYQDYLRNLPSKPDVSHE